MYLQHLPKLLTGLLLICAFTIQAQVASFSYTQDFESGLSGWTSTFTPPFSWFGGGEGTGWQIGTPAAPIINSNSPAGGTNSIVTNRTGDYGFLETATLISPTLDFTLVCNPVLSFNYWAQLGASSILTIEVSSRNSLGYQSVQVFSSINNTSDWTTTSIDLSMFAGQKEVKIKFFFLGIMPAEGIALDDIAIFNNVNAGISLGNSGCECTFESESISKQLNDLQGYPIASIVDPAGGSDLGLVTAKAVIDSALPTYNGQPYLQRHYVINTDANDNGVLVKLYFTDEEFQALRDEDPSVTTLWDLFVTSFPGTKTAPQADSSELHPVVNVTMNDLGSGIHSIEFMTDHFSTFFVHGGGGNALPIELAEFDAYKSGNNVILKWATATERNNSHFEIEAATGTQSDELDFERIGKVNGAGDANNFSYYRFTDYEAKISGTKYYRLKQVDFDGTFSYSQIVAVDWQANISAEVYPNPFAESLTVKVAGAEKGKLHIAIFNVMGQLVYQQQTEVNYSGQKVSLELPQALAAGHYTMTIQHGDKNFSFNLVRK